MNVKVDVLKTIAQETGQAVLEIYHQEATWDTREKDDGSPLTIADQRANEIIVSELQTVYPDYAILSEEGKNDLSRLDKDYCFVVDPLDGTKEFIKKNGQFTVNIALCHRGNPVAGIIYVPVTEEIYWASECDGAFYENLRTGEKEKLQVSERKTNLIVVGSKSHAAEEEKKLYKKHEKDIAEITSMGSSLKGCQVARGLADVYYRFGLTSEWDTAAMQCIVEEAGGIFRQMDGSVMRYNREDNLNRKGFYIVNRKENIWV